MGDFSPDGLDSRSLRTPWEWKNRVLLASTTYERDAKCAESSQHRSTIRPQQSHSRHHMGILWRSPESAACVSGVPPRRGPRPCRIIAVVQKKPLLSEIPQSRVPSTYRKVRTTATLAWQYGTRPDPEQVRTPAPSLQAPLVHRGSEGRVDA